MQQFAENDTDRIIESRYFPAGFIGVAVEVGAATPEFLSMTQRFRLRGWRCLCIEPNPDFAEQHRQRGNEVYQVACGERDADDQDFQIVNKPGASGPTDITAHSHSSLRVKEEYRRADPSFASYDLRIIKVNVRRLDAILASAGVIRVDLLSVDVEGWELEVMRGFSVDVYKPRVIVLENWLHQREYATFMAERGYKLDGRVEHNYVFSPA